MTLARGHKTRDDSALIHFSRPDRLREGFPGRVAPAPASAVLIRSDSGGTAHEFLTGLTRPGRRLH